MNTAVAPGLLGQKRTKVQIPWSAPVEEIGMGSKVRKEAEKDASRLIKVDFGRSGFAVEPVGIADRLGVQVVEATFDESILGGLFLKPGRDPEIVLNRGHSFFRRRLTCALEMGHYVYMSARTCEYTRADLYDGSEQFGGEADDAYAREFAGSLLMPEGDIKILVDLQMDDLDMALRFRVRSDAGSTGIARLPRLRSEGGVMSAGNRNDAIGEISTGRENEPSPSPGVPAEFRYLDEQERAQGLALRRLFAEQEHGLRQRYADWILWLLGAQFVVADAVFVAFAWAGSGWVLPSGVIEVWLAATVVQVVGVVAVVTRHLFPARDGVGVG
jgi:Zn-dependent peptidase ImmA (M78 family)